MPLPILQILVQVLTGQGVTYKLVRFLVMGTNPECQVSSTKFDIASPYENSGTPIPQIQIGMIQTIAMYLNISILVHRPGC